MPKLKKKRALTKVLYAYTTPTNDKWIRATAKKSKMSRSMLVNELVNTARAQSGK